MPIPGELPLSSQTDVPDLVDLDAVKDQLDIPRANTDEDVELQRFLAAASEGIAYNCGSSAPVQYTERKQGGGALLALNHRPVQQIVSVTPVGLGNVVPVDLTTLDVDQAAGTVGLLGYGALWPCRPHVVVYTAGRLTVPASLEMAALLIVQHLHRTQRRKTAGLPGRGQGGDDVTAMPGFAFAIPNRAKEMMAPFLLPPGTA